MSRSTIAGDNDDVAAVGASEARKPRKRTPAAQQARKRSRQALMDLDEGDLLEYSISASIRTRTGGEMWIKGGATTTIRADETADEAKDRLRKAVESFVSVAAQEMRS